MNVTSTFLGVQRFLVTSIMTRCGINIYYRHIAGDENQNTSTGDSFLNKNMFAEGEAVHINSQEDLIRQEISGSTKSEINPNSSKGTESEASDIANREGSSRLG